jgi:hypothetical protein
MSYGKTLVEAIIQDMAHRGLEPDCRERQLLDIAAKLGDKLEALSNAIDADGISVKLKSGRPIIHPAVAEVRQVSLALAKVLDGVSMDEGAPVNRARQAAAQARWRRHNEAKAARQAGAN